MVLDMNKRHSIGNQQDMILEINKIHDFENQQIYDIGYVQMTWYWQSTKDMILDMNKRCNAGNQ